MPTAVYGLLKAATALLRELDGHLARARHVRSAEQGFRLVPWLGGLLIVGGVVLIARSDPPAEEERDRQGGTGLADKLLYPFILMAGALQAVGVAWSAQLRDALANPWLAATVSFVPVVIGFALVFLLRPSPLPKRDDVAGVRWWMPLAGLAGAVAIFGGLLFANKVGAGTFNGSSSRPTC